MSTTSRIVSNTTQSVVNKLAGSIIGFGSKTIDKGSDIAKAAKFAFGDAGKAMAKNADEAFDAAKSGIMAMKGIDADTAQDVVKGIHNAGYGIQNQIGDSTRNIQRLRARQADATTDAVRGAITKQIDTEQSAIRALSGQRNAAMEEVAKASGIDTASDAWKTVKGDVTRSVAQDEIVGSAMNEVLSAPVSMPLTYLTDGGPISTYAKGAIGVTAFQFANGSRRSLTEQNGQRDIAGIPFI